MLHLSSYLCVVARSVVNIQHSIGCLVHGLVVFSWYDVITCESSVHTFIRFFSIVFLFLTFLNIHIYFIILKTYDQQFTLTTKKSLHIIFKYIFNNFTQSASKATQFGEITQNNGHNAVQGHSWSPIESSYATSY